MNPLTILAVVLCVVCVQCDYPAKEQYELQRSFDGTTWETRASLTVSRSEASTPARLKVVPSPAHSVKGIAVAEALMYRVVNSKSTVTASLVTSPCALVRGFDAASPQSLRIPESIGVIVAEGTHISGLQLTPSTNTHHSSIKASDCDRSILSLFPNIDATLTVALVKSVEPKMVSNFEDFPAVTGAPPPKKAPATDAAGEQKAAPEEDNRSFIDKYWWYIVMFGLYTVVNGFLGSKGAPQGQAAPQAGGKK